MFLCDILGVNYTFLTGVLFYSVGNIIRVVFGMRSFSAAVVGSVVAQCGQPFFQCLSASIPALWFRKNRRAVATALGVVSDFFGVGFGMFITGLSEFTEDPPSFIVFGAVLNLLGILV